MFSRDQGDPAIALARSAGLAGAATTSATACLLNAPGSPGLPDQVARGNGHNQSNDDELPVHGSSSQAGSDCSAEPGAQLIHHPGTDVRQDSHVYECQQRPAPTTGLAL